MEKRQVKAQINNMPRTSAVDHMSDIVMPEPESLTSLPSMGSITSGGLGDGIAGNGGRGGNSIGIGAFDGAQILGMVGGDSSGKLFGFNDPGKGALIGSFYDLKQTKDGEPTGMDDAAMRNELREIVSRGYNPKLLDKYFKASRELYQTRFWIPHMNADAAPAAFECEKEVAPKHWLAVYRGSVIAPSSGRFRFVGSSDDVLHVRFNDRPVFDYGHTLASTATRGSPSLGNPDGSWNDDGMDKIFRNESPMRLPITFYKYPSMPTLNNSIGGMAVGPEFKVEKGKAYPIEVLIAEIPGGFFAVSLLIEEIGVKYEKNATGAPILPLFRLDASLPDKATMINAPPFADDGPIWKFVETSSRPGI